VALKYEASTSVLVADVDCTIDSELCETYGVESYPSLKYFFRGSKEAHAYKKGQDEYRLGCDCVFVSAEAPRQAYRGSLKTNLM
jgi:hypothetical protein